MYEKQSYGKCNFCGADRVKNPKTGKIFCSDKCWTKSKGSSELKNPPERGEASQQAHDSAPAGNPVFPCDFKS